MPRPDEHPGPRRTTPDIGGWTCLICGMAIVAATVLTPAWVENRELKLVNASLRAEAKHELAKLENYKGFVVALERDDPILLQRLAWRRLKLKPVNTSIVEPGSDSAELVATLDQWMEPVVLETPPLAERPVLADTALTRLLVGESRIWALAFGGAVILVGLLVTPRNRGPAQLTPNPEP